LPSFDTNFRCGPILPLSSNHSPSHPAVKSEKEAPGTSLPQSAHLHISYSTETTSSIGTKPASRSDHRSTQRLCIHMLETEAKIPSRPVPVIELFQASLISIGELLRNKEGAVGSSSRFTSSRLNTIHFQTRHPIDQTADPLTTAEKRKVSTAPVPLLEYLKVLDPLSGNSCLRLICCLVATQTPPLPQRSH
jgi:hypothetical protein